MSGAAVPQGTPQLTAPTTLPFLLRGPPVNLISDKKVDKKFDKKKPYLNHPCKAFNGK